MFGPLNVIQVSLIPHPLALVCLFTLVASVLSWYACVHYASSGTTSFR